MSEIKKIIYFQQFVKEIEIQIGRKLNNYELQFAKDKLFENIQQTAAASAILIADSLKQQANYETTKSNDLRQNIWDRNTKQFISTN